MVREDISSGQAVTEHVTNASQPVSTIPEGTGPEAKSRLGWSRWIAGLLIAGIVWWIIGRSSQIETAGRTLLTGQWQWLLVAAAFQFAYFVLYAANYQQAFAAVGVSARIRELLPVLLASLVLGEVAPVGWAAGSAVFVRYSTRRGIPGAQALIATLFAQASDLFMFSCVFLLGTVALALRHDMTVSVTAGVLMNVGLVGTLTLAVGWPVVLSRMWLFAQSLVCRITRKQGSILTSVMASGAAVRKQPKRVFASLSMAGLANAAALMSLGLVSLAFHQTVSFGVLVACYGIGVMAWMVSPVPTSIGVVEGAMTLVLSSLGVPAGRAAVIAVAYRGLSFWIPFLIGVFALHRVERGPDEAQRR